MPKIKGAENKQRKKYKQRKVTQKSVNENSQQILQLYEFIGNCPLFRGSECIFRATRQSSQLSGVMYDEKKEEAVVAHI